MDPHADLATHFTDFAGTTRRDSPLYSALSRVAAATPEVLDLLAGVDERQRRPVLLFAVIHDLLLAGMEHPLAAYYPSTGGHRAIDDGLGEAFVDFCRIERAGIAERVGSSSTQTNEVNRCAALLPAIAWGTSDVDGDVALVEVGTSAGLNLWFDRFVYRYDDGAGAVVAKAGEDESAVRCRCTLRGDGRPPERLTVPIGARIGIDVAPVDVRDEDAARWLVACVWPDQHDRIERLLAAIELARTDAPPVQEMDAVDAIDAHVVDADDALHPVVFHSWVLSYLPADRQAAFADALASAGSRRDLTWVIAEQPGEVPGLPVPEGRRDATALVVVRWRNGERTVTRVADMHPHGRWLEWLARD